MSLILKTIAIGVMLVLFTIVFVVIGSIRADRERYREQVVREVSASTAGAQTVTGPLLLARFRHRVEYRSNDSTGRALITYRIEEGAVVVLPESLTIRAETQVESRRRGIHEARVLDGPIELTAEFAPPGPDAIRGFQVVEWLPAYVVVGVGDSRGLRRTPDVTWRGSAVQTAPGTRLGGIPQGFSAVVEPWSVVDGARSDVTVRLRLTGTERLGFVPVGKETEVTMTSPWPHPSFTGRILPDERTVRADGFSATWHTSQFASGVGDLAGRLNLGVVEGFDKLDFGVSFIDPIDVYRLSDRAVKYGMMFVLLTFVGFFLIEVLRRLEIHPIQYGLVGFALAAFFLLLLSLSEHLPFVAAYVIASLGCLGLIVHYLSHVLRSSKRALGFGAGLAALYALLYVVLRSEDYALLLGTLVLFGVLGFVMLATRRVDWNKLGQPQAE